MRPVWPYHLINPIFFLSMSNQSHLIKISLLVIGNCVGRANFSSAGRPDDHPFCRSVTLDKFYTESRLIEIRHFVLLPEFCTSLSMSAIRPRRKMRSNHESYYSCGDSALRISLFVIGLITLISLYNDSTSDAGCVSLHRSKSLTIVMAQLASVALGAAMPSALLLPPAMFSWFSRSLVSFSILSRRSITWEGSTSCGLCWKSISISILQITSNKIN